MAPMLAPAVALAILVLFSAFPGYFSDDLNTDALALQTLRSAVGRSALPSWNSSTPTCSWQGLTCENGRVTELRLPGAGLMGGLPSGVLGNLSALRTLSLRYNALTGPIPDDLSRLAELRAIYFQHNSFSGEVPASLFSLKNLVRLDLAGNKFSGQISPDFNKLNRLGTLFLDGNDFSGEIPKLDVPTLENFNVSYNKLNGSIPTKLRKMPKESFLGTGLCGGPLGLCPGESAPTPTGSPEGGGVDVGGGRKKKLSGGAIVGIAIGCVIGVLLLLALLFFCRKRSSAARSAMAVEKVRDLQMPPLEVEPKAPNGSAAHVAAAAAAPGAAAAAATAAAKSGGAMGGSKKLIFFGPMAAAPPFDLEDLLRASAEVLGKGAFGTAYKAVMESGGGVAVKRLKDVDLPEPEFRERIAVIGAVQHELVVPLRAYYFSKDEKLLVYDYMSMGSLSALLHVRFAFTCAQVIRLSVSLRSTKAAVQLFTNTTRSTVLRPSKEFTAVVQLFTDITRSAVLRPSKEFTVAVQLFTNTTRSTVLRPSKALACGWSYCFGIAGLGSNTTFRVNRYICENVAEVKETFNQPQPLSVGSASSTKKRTRTVRAATASKKLFKDGDIDETHESCSQDD